MMCRFATLARIFITAITALLPTIEARKTKTVIPRKLHVPYGGSKCQASPQPNLRFNVSSFSSYSAGLPYGIEDESLAEAICCDKYYTGYAEPNGFYAWDSVSFFRLWKNNKNHPITLYDSICGIPLFIVPIGRSVKDFMDDTMEHGWPSFREEEVIRENVLVQKDGRTVRSKCGTQLGTYEPDEDGLPRYCMDVSCVAGHPIRGNSLILD